MVSSEEEREESERPQKHSTSSLGFLLLGVIADRESNELCRERSALCLRDYLSSILSSLLLSDFCSDFASGLRGAFTLQKEFVFHLYIEYSLLPCFVVSLKEQTYLLPLSLGGVTGEVCSFF